MIHNASNESHHPKTTIRVPSTNKSKDLIQNFGKTIFKNILTFIFHIIEGKKSLIIKYTLCRSGLRQDAIYTEDQILGKVWGRNEKAYVVKLP